MVSYVLYDEIGIKLVPEKTYPRKIASCVWAQNLKRGSNDLQLNYLCYAMFRKKESYVFDPRYVFVIHFNQFGIFLSTGVPHWWEVNLLFRPIFKFSDSRFFLEIMILKKYRLVRKSNHPFLVLKGVTEMSFLVLKRLSGNSEDQYFILPNYSLVIELQFGNIEY